MGQIDRDKQHEYKPDAKHGVVLLKQLKQVNPDRYEELLVFFTQLKKLKVDDQLAGRPGNIQFLPRPQWITEIPTDDFADIMNFWLNA